MFCNYCRNEFEPWVNLGGKPSRFCKDCHNVSRVYVTIPETKERFCILCGEVINRDRGAKIYCSHCRTYKAKKDAILSPRVIPSTASERRRRARRSQQSRAWQARNKSKVKAQSIASKAHPLALVIVYECPCNHPKKHNHHFDYELPLMVVRLCPSCHAKEHARLRAEAELERKTI